MTLKDCQGCKNLKERTTQVNVSRSRQCLIKQGSRKYALRLSLSESSNRQLNCMSLSLRRLMLNLRISTREFRNSQTQQGSLVIPTPTVMLSFFINQEYVLLPRCPQTLFTLVMTIQIQNQNVFGEKIRQYGMRLNCYAF